MLKKAFFILILVVGGSACSSKAVYTNLARHQCFQDAQAQQGSDHASCQLEEKIDGLSYEEYLRQRNQ